MTQSASSSTIVVDDTKKKVYVQNGEVMAYAVTKCSICHGTGEHRYVQPDGTRTVKVCQKAFRRFVKANPGVIFDPKEGTFYRLVEDLVVIPSNALVDVDNTPEPLPFVGYADAKHEVTA
jgi:hypothetical protein